MECLDALKGQSYPLDGIYIIDNASTDETPKLLLEKGYISELPPKSLTEPWEKEFSVTNDQKVDIKIHYVRMNENTGSSGGFYEGIKRSYERKYDWIWIMDDDATPKLNALEELLKFKDISLSAIASVVIKRGTEEIDLNHRRKFNIKDKPISLEIYQRNYFYFNEFSYVGVLINSCALKLKGFTNRDFFISGDDTEHSLRLSEYGKMICVTSSHIIHGSKAEIIRNNISTSQTMHNLSTFIDYKAYYSIRNRIFISRKYRNPLFFFFYVEKLKIRNYIGRLIKRRDKVVYNLYKEAIEDGMKGNLGIKLPYVPGWQYQRISKSDTE